MKRCRKTMLVVFLITPGGCKTLPDEDSSIRAVREGSSGAGSAFGRFQSQCAGTVSRDNPRLLRSPLFQGPPMPANHDVVKNAIKRQTGKLRGGIRDLPRVRKLFENFKNQGFRTIDGSANNRRQQRLGKSETPFNRVAPPAYGQSSTPRGSIEGRPPFKSELPSARVISNYIHDGLNFTKFFPPSRNQQRNFKDAGDDRRTPKGASDMLWLWGQFVDHDLTLSEPRPDGAEFPIPVPEVWGMTQSGEELKDVMMPEGGVLPFRRTLGTFIRNTNINRFEQINFQTHFLDGSMIYGATPQRCQALRTMTVHNQSPKDPSLPSDVDSFEVGATGWYSPGGQLYTNPFYRDRNADGLLPQNYRWGRGQDFGPNAAGPVNKMPPQQLFLAGDVRANEHIGLTAMHNVFLLEHNKIVRAIIDQNKRQKLNLNDNEIFELARHIVIAEVQAITFREFLPLLLGVGPDGVHWNSQYDEKIDPSITNEFATAAYRVGHTFVSPTIGGGQRPLSALFFEPLAVRRQGITGILGAISHGYARGSDPYFTKILRNMLFGAPVKAGSESSFKTIAEGGKVRFTRGSDLPALNIQRGRDHGLATYFDTRQALGLPPTNAQEAFLPEIVPALQALSFKHSYAPANYDLFVGGLIEKPLAKGGKNRGRNSLMGPTFTEIIKRQFTALRDGDRFFYTNGNIFDEAWIHWINEQTLSKIIARNSNTKIGMDAFCASPNASQFTFEGVPRGICNSGGADAAGLKIRQRRAPAQGTNR